MYGSLISDGQSKYNILHSEPYELSIADMPERGTSAAEARASALAWAQGICEAIASPAIQVLDVLSDFGNESLKTIVGPISDVTGSFKEATKKTASLLPIAIIVVIIVVVVIFVVKGKKNANS